MLDDDFEAEQISSYTVPNASDIAGGLPNLSGVPCSARIDDFFDKHGQRPAGGYNSTDDFLRIFRRWRSLMQRWLEKNFDFTIIDCPPSMAIQVRTFLPIATGYIVPSLPDRLSVRGSLWLLDRLRRLNVKIQGLGTLWSLYRQQNPMHRKIVEATAKHIEPYAQLPRPFKTVIPNAAAIAEATEPDRKPHTFNAKYSSQFARLYRALSEEIVQRSQWQSAAPKQEGVVAAGR